MATVSYRRPGVYTSESLLPLVDVTPASSGAAVSAFVGTSAAGGPTTPVLVRSWLDYVNRFGGFGANADLLPFAVFEYFNNGGGPCYVRRAVTADAVAATVTLDATTTPMLTVTASSVGLWGNSLSVVITAKAAGIFDLSVLRGTRLAERFSDLSLDHASASFVENIVNSPVSGSSLIRVASQVSGAYITADAPDAATTALTGGTDGTGAATLAAAALSLSDVSDVVLNINLPGVTSGAILNPVIAWAEASGRAFIVIDAPRTEVGTGSSTATSTLRGQQTGGDAVTASSRSAIYGPWITFQDPSSTVAGATRLLPVGGAVLGQYAVSDATRGVQKAPAGLSTVLRGALVPSVKFSDSDLETLNDSGINIVRAIPGAGIVIMGARTQATGFPDRYVAIRRTLMSISQALTINSRYALFEPNDSALWAKLSATVDQYLMSLYQAGVLHGNTSNQAYFVQCDGQNNPPSSVAVGVVNVTVGLALSASAEFIVINISQMTASSATAS